MNIKAEIASRLSQAYVSIFFFASFDGKSTNCTIFQTFRANSLLRAGGDERRLINDEERVLDKIWSITMALME